MQRASATVVCVTGEHADRVIGRIAAANVTVSSPPADHDPLDRAAAALHEVAGAHILYFVHDADPLAAVARAWVRLFEESGPIGEVEVAVHETLARWRAGTLELPDYYVVLDAEALSPTWRHWYLGVLHTAAPGRVVPTPASPTALTGALQRLQPGRWWPPLPEMLEGIERRAPDVDVAGLTNATPARTARAAVAGPGGPPA